MNYLEALKGPFISDAKIHMEYKKKDFKGDIVLCQLRWWLCFLKILHLWDSISDQVHILDLVMIPTVIK